MTKVLKTAGIAIVLAATFLIGAVSHRHRSVFANLFHQGSLGAKKRGDKIYQIDAELLDCAFKERIVERQLFPPCRTPEDLHAAIERMNFPVAEFSDAYNRIKIRSQELTGDICRIDYQVGEGNFLAYAYVLKAGESNQSDRAAVLIIPGTGTNQSTEIFKRNRENYQSNIVDAFVGKADIYVYVKPNEDFLAIHNGRNKVRADFFVRYLLNRDGSYSAKYMVDTLSFSKYLKGCYSKVVVAGLSQGGEAALVNSLQSAPNLAIVASGFSVLTECLDWAGFEQIIVPGLRRFYSNQKIRETISGSATNYLFTYGKGEGWAYKVEAEEQLTRSYFESLPNVFCTVHDGGHAYDLDTVMEFLKKHQ